MEIHNLAFILLGLVAVYLVSLRLHRIIRRQRLKSAPFPPAWETILAEKVNIYRRLPAKLQQTLQRDILVFLGEKNIEGCAGLVITDQVRLTIAASACVLLLRRKGGYYPKLITILVYPEAYVARETNFVGGVATAAPSLRAGESWGGGTVVLAWDHVRQQAVDLTGGHNVVIHEFAHQLDQEDGSADGVPILEETANYRAWATICSGRFKRLQEKLRRHKGSLLDKYGATNPAEFFAVATEAFFEKSRRLKRGDPELYGLLAAYYKIDPATWESSA